MLTFFKENADETRRRIAEYMDGCLFYFHVVQYCDVLRTVTNTYCVFINASGGRNNMLPQASVEKGCKRGVRGSCRE